MTPLRNQRRRSLWRRRALAIVNGGVATAATPATIAYGAGLVTAGDDPDAFLWVIIGWSFFVGSVRVLYYYRAAQFPSKANIAGNVFGSVVAGSITAMLAWSRGHTDPMALLGGSLLVAWFGVDGIKWLAGRALGGQLPGANGGGGGATP